MIYGVNVMLEATSNIELQIAVPYRSVGTKNR